MKQFDKDHLLIVPNSVLVSAYIEVYYNKDPHDTCNVKVSFQDFVTCDWEATPKVTNEMAKKLRAVLESYDSGALDEVDTIDKIEELLFVPKSNSP